MPKGIFPFRTLKDLMEGLENEFEKYNKQNPDKRPLQAPSRPTLYRYEEEGVWKPTQTGANGWRKFNDEDLEQAIQNILKHCARL